MKNGGILQGSRRSNSSVTFLPGFWKFTKMNFESFIHRYLHYSGKQTQIFIYFPAALRKRSSKQYGQLSNSGSAWVLAFWMGF